MSHVLPIMRIRTGQCVREWPTSSAIAALNAVQLAGPGAFPHMASTGKRSASILRAGNSPRRVAAAQLLRADRHFGAVRGSRGRYRSFLPMNSRGKGVAPSAKHGCATKKPTRDGARKARRAKRWARARGEAQRATSTRDREDRRSFEVAPGPHRVMTTPVIFGSFRTTASRFRSTGSRFACLPAATVFSPSDSTPPSRPWAASAASSSHRRRALR
jgi:hypothetical protein